MNDADARPDPDTLLKRVAAEEAREQSSALKLFFGFAPGVGKTYAMLESARRLRAQGIDVAVGVALTHGRKETQALLEGLEIIPLRRIDYRGQTLEELDLDQALARKPQLLLVDELAHTNAPGSRHKKRWQDVLELLDAGIGVHTTLNVQHIESLNDVVAQITRVQVRETVPDSMLERATEVELVDISPEDLLARLREGKVYLGEQATRATQHFFQRGNLLALRELALRRTAERVNRDVLAFREEHGVEATWPTADKILVCVGPAPASGRLVRSARRMAAGLRAAWVAAYVETPDVSLMKEADRERLEEHLRLAESLGATVVRLSGANISEPILTYARRNNVARIIIGKPTRLRLRDLVRRSLVTDIVRGSGDIDVHVISGDVAAADNDASSTSEKKISSPIPWARYLRAALLVLPATGLALAAHDLLDVPDVEMLYLIAVMIAAIAFGRGPSVAAAALSIIAYNFCFVPPRFTLSVADGRYFLSFTMMFVVSLVISTLALRIKRQQQDAVQREERTAVLYALSRNLGTALDFDQAVRITAEHASHALNAAVVVLLENADGELAPFASFPVGTALEPNELGVAKWVREHGRSAGFGTDTLPGSKSVCVPLQTSSAPIGALALLLKQPEPLSADQRGFVEAIARQAAFAIERGELAIKARQSTLRAKTEELRSALLSTVSHDLRTPIAAITGAGTALRDEQNLDATVRREMVNTICEEADRLEHIVSNLLDMTRLESGAIALKKDWVPVVELVGGARNRLTARLASHPVTTSLPDELPMISVDPVMMEQLLVNLLENAGKYTPTGAPIEVWAAKEDNTVALEVRDRGPGLPKGDEERVFERFYRGAHASVPGAGLGLAICRAIARAHGGTLIAKNRADGGAVFRLTIPLEGSPPSMS